MTPNFDCETSGDSYSQTGFNITLAKPSASNPIGNPPLPGWTASGGLNWVGFLASQYNAANPLLTYNFAYGGATTNATLVTPWKPEVLSFIDQVAEFSGSIGAKPKPEYAPWTGEDALVGVWMGVNDVGNSWWLGNYDALLEQIMDSYFGQLQIVYEAGARNFVLLTVPRESFPPSSSPYSSFLRSWRWVVGRSSQLTIRIEKKQSTRHPPSSPTLQMRRRTKPCLSRNTTTPSPRG